MVVNLLICVFLSARLPVPARSHCGVARTKHFDQYAMRAGQCKKEVVPLFSNVAVKVA